MGLSCALLGTIFLALLIVHSSEASDLEALGDQKTGNNVKDSGISNKKGSGKEKVVIPEKKRQDQLGSGLKEGADKKIIEDGKGEQVESKGNGNKQKKTDGSGSEKKRIDGTGSELKKTDITGSEQKNSDDNSSEQEAAKDKITNEDIDKNDKSRGNSGAQSKDISMPQVRKEGGEACDSSSNSCTIEENAVIACLRVAGSESEELSLLIQNKGKALVSVRLSTPDFVQLDKKRIQVQANKNEKVKVSIRNGKGTNGIILIAGNGNCTIDIKQISTQGSKKGTVSAQLAYINLFKSTPSAWFMPLAAILVIASVCIAIGIRRKYAARNRPSYEKLEMELPVSDGSKVKPDSSDGWDDSWGDSWDDEEAPKTPSMPVTPSISSNGMASRRVNKEAWKD